MAYQMKEASYDRSSPARKSPKASRSKKIRDDHDEINRQVAEINNELVPDDDDNLMFQRDEDASLGDQTMGVPK